MWRKHTYLHGSERLSSSYIRYMPGGYTGAKLRTVCIPSSRQRHGRREKKTKCIKTTPLDSLCPSVPSAFGSEHCARMHLDID